MEISTLNSPPQFSHVMYSRVRSALSGVFLPSDSTDFSPGTGTTMVHGMACNWLVPLSLCRSVNARAGSVIAGCRRQRIWLAVATGGFVAEGSKVHQDHDKVTLTHTTPSYSNAIDAYDTAVWEIFPSSFDEDLILHHRQSTGYISKGV